MLIIHNSLIQNEKYGRGFPLVKEKELRPDKKLSTK